MNKKFPMLCAAVLLVLSIGGCAQLLSGKKWGESTAFTSDIYTISHPSGWEVEGHEAFVYFRPSPVNDSAENQGNVVIYVAPAEPGNLTLVDFFQDSVMVLIGTTPEFTLIEIKEERISSTPAYRIVYTGGEGSGKTQYLQVFALEGGNTYVITYAAPQETYTKYADNAEEMIRSFKIK